MTGTADFQSIKNSTFGDREVGLVVTTATDSMCISQAMDLLCDFGRFVTIGKTSLANTPASPPSNVVVADFNLGKMRESSPKKVAQLWKTAWDRAGTEGLPSAPTIRSFPVPRIEQALEYLRSDKCSGSVVVKLASNHKISIPPPKPAKLKLGALATYVRAGGLGEIGRSIADMTFEAGARNISFISGFGASSEEGQLFIESLRIRGCNAQAYECDITKPEQI